MGKCEQKRKKRCSQSTETKIRKTEILSGGPKPFNDTDSLFGDTNKDLNVLNELQNDDNIFYEQFLEEDQWMETKTDTSRKRSRKRDSFIDEAARLAEIDAHLFCGNVRIGVL